MTLTEQLWAAREAATEAKIALRHAKNEAADFLTWFTSSIDYDALGKNAPARKLAFEELLAKDERAHKYECAVRIAEDAKDRADCELSCLLDERHAREIEIWAILAQAYQKRTAFEMPAKENAGRDLLKTNVEYDVADAVPF
ncbi:MAG: hypothetical protein SXV54_26655 [Chloroflexota bacterium]|nr:hypothetical protein [Chloroflexota bacterium]